MMYLNSNITGILILTHLSFGGSVSNTASSMLKFLKLSSSFGKLFSSQAGVKRTGTCSEATLVNELCLVG